MNQPLDDDPCQGRSQSGHEKTSNSQEGQWRPGQPAARDEQESGDHQGLTDAQHQRAWPEAPETVTDRSRKSQPREIDDVDEDADRSGEDVG